MGLSAAQVAAFKAAVGGPSSGYTPGAFATLFGLIVAAAVLLWAGYIVLRLGQDALAGRLKIEGLLTYKVRVLVLVMVVIALLW